MTSDQVTGAQVPLVSYLELDPPHLVANECTRCGARYFDRRNACASCGGEAFSPVDIDTEGKVRTFSIVAFSIPGVEVPFVAAIVDCGGTSVRGVLTGVTPDPEHVNVGMLVKLVTVSQGVDEDGVEAIGYAFAPVTSEENR
ncbi:MAG: uncharacterized protein V7643_4380 [Mycobacterium sp.]|jgi:uncharacterized OB-fold protein